MSTVYGYARVSTVGQDESGLGEEAQRNTIDRVYKAKLAEAHTFGGTVFDQVSGSVPFFDRENGAALNRKLRRGDVVVMSKVDRAFRRLHDLLNTVQQWHDRGVRVVFCDFMGQDIELDTFAGKMLLALLGLVAEAEWFRASDRCKDKAAAARATNRPVNQIAPYGYRIGARQHGRILYPDLGQRRFTRQLIKWYDGGQHYRAIGDHLAQLKADGHDGILTTNWHAVRRWVLAERDLMAKEQALGILDSTEKFLMPSGDVVGLDYFPKRAQDVMREHLADPVN